MMRVSVGHDRDISDSYLKKMCQLGVDCIDFSHRAPFPGLVEQGYPDLDGLLRIRKRLRSHGMDWNRVSLPEMTEEFFLDFDGADRELENSANALKVFAEAGAPIAVQRCQGNALDHLVRRHRAIHRGGYIGPGDTVLNGRPNPVSADDLREQRDVYVCGAGGSETYSGKSRPLLR